MADILIDIDGVCADLLNELLARYNHDYDDTLSPQDITRWELEQFVKPSCGTRIYDYFTEEFVHQLKVYPGTHEVLWRLSNEHRLVAVTAVTSYLAAARGSWIARKLPMIQHVIVAHNKSCVQGDIFIDDAPHHLEDHPAPLKIIMDQPYNRHHLMDIPRAYTWSDVESIIEQWQCNNKPVNDML